jgi:alpha-amylase/alpha-mannosidase (GH57 family)
MDKYICVHGHFYQPPRENPWLEEVEMDDTAYPYHDWNDRITEECYKQNAASRILGPGRKIIDIVNNYSKMSFDFGPTLLYWLQSHAPDVYESILEVDRESRKAFSGHGAAIAQAYNHIILPLANSRDKRTQVLWGIRDFEHRFGRKPEGMWLPETAVDIETLEVLAENDLKFSILIPRQAPRFRKIGERQWKDISQDELDTTRAYLCRLPSGRTINLFFSHAQTADNVANGRLLKNGEIFAQKLCGIFADSPEPAQLAHIATDGETYGHHHRHADMALAYCFHYIKCNKLANITVYGEHLEKFPPTYEVEILENTSWSCSHGLERWRANCGCHYGRYPSGAQQWRGPLREAMDWLRDQLAGIYETKMLQYVDEPWNLRNEYISVILDRNSVESFLTSMVRQKLSDEERVTGLKLLEMQRHAMLMFTSCGWFFDDISGIETIQILSHACRAMQLATEVAGDDFEPTFKAILEKAPTNVREFSNGKEVYEALVRPHRTDLNRVGAHFALSSVFADYSDESDIFCYSAKTESYERLDAGIQVLATGRAAIQSKIVLETHRVDFAVLHLGDHNLIGAVSTQMPEAVFSSACEKLKEAFNRGDTTDIMRLMNVSFGGNNYSLWHLFKDEQRRILYQLLQTVWQEIEASFRHIYEHNYTIIQMIRGMGMPLPKALSTPAEFILNQEICRVIQDDQADSDLLQKLVDEATRLSLQLDQATLRFQASHKVDRLMAKLENSPYDLALLESLETTLRLLLKAASSLDSQAPQNVFFRITKETYAQMKKKADSGQADAKGWIELMTNLADYLGVAIA